METGSAIKNKSYGILKFLNLKEGKLEILQTIIQVKYKEAQKY